MEVFSSIHAFQKTNKGIKSFRKLSRLKCIQILICGINGTKKSFYD